MIYQGWFIADEAYLITIIISIYHGDDNACPSTKTLKWKKNGKRVLLHEMTRFLTRFLSSLMKLGENSINSIWIMRRTTVIQCNLMIGDESFREDSSRKRQNQGRGGETQVWSALEAGIIGFTVYCTVAAAVYYKLASSLPAPASKLEAPTHLCLCL